MLWAGATSLTSQKPFCPEQCLPCPKDENSAPSWNFPQGLAPLYHCHGYYLKVPTGDKVLLFTLFLLFSSPRAVCRQEAGCKCLA